MSKRFIGETPPIIEPPGPQQVVAHGWICLACKKVYETQDEAEKCAATHEEISIRAQYELGNEIPSAVEVRKTSAGRILWSRWFSLVERDAP